MVYFKAQEKPVLSLENVVREIVAYIAFRILVRSEVRISPDFYSRG